MTPTIGEECEETRLRATMVARAAPTVGDSIARSHATSLREAGLGSPQGEWIRQRLEHELESARVTIHRVLADHAPCGEALRLAEMYEICRIWRDMDPEIADLEARIAHELAQTHGIPIESHTTPPRRFPRVQQRKDTPQ